MKAETNKHFHLFDPQMLLIVLVIVSIWVLVVMPILVLEIPIIVLGILSITLIHDLMRFRVRARN